MIRLLNEHLSSTHGHGSLPIRRQFWFCELANVALAGDTNSADCSSNVARLKYWRVCFRTQTPVKSAIGPFLWFFVLNDIFHKEDFSRLQSICYKSRCMGSSARNLQIFLSKGSSETPKLGAMTCGKGKLYFQASILVIDAFLVWWSILIFLTSAL